MYGNEFELDQSFGARNLGAERHVFNVVVRDARRELRVLRAQPVVDEVRVAALTGAMAVAQVESRSLQAEIMAQRALEV